MLRKLGYNLNAKKFTFAYFGQTTFVIYPPKPKCVEGEIMLRTDITCLRNWTYLSEPSRSNPVGDTLPRFEQK